jgi:hypothetical protein
MPAKKIRRSRVWRTFLKIDNAILGDAPPIDALLLKSMGCEESTPIVIDLLRQHVLPMLRGAQRRYIQHYWFLVHNRESGVPTVESDKSIYLDITIVFGDPCVFLPGDPFVMTRPHELGDACAGWDTKKLHHGIESVYGLLDAQARLVVQFLESFRKDTDDLTVLRHMRQYMHYFSNATQMRIS